MKKSKIIVPALGIIALSTAASITGTVAWFTASKTAQISAGEFAVTKTSNNLKVALTKGAGTSINGNTVEVLDYHKLTDASFSHLNRMVYIPDEEGDAIDATHSFSVDSATTGTGASTVAAAADIRSTYVDAQSNTNKVLSVMTWDMEVTVEFGSVGGDMALYLKQSSKVEVKKTGGNTPTWSESESDMTTALGFRVAFIPLTVGNDSDESKGAQYRVWAEHQVAAKCKHISAPTDAMTGVAYAEKYLVHKDYTAALPNSEEFEWDTGTKQAKDRPDCLGKFTFSENSQVKLNYRVVCWYEGTDENIVNRSSVDEYQTVRATIDLEAVKLKAPTPAQEPEP